jgi:hypothetical protein
MTYLTTSTETIVALVDTKVYVDRSTSSTVIATLTAGRAALLIERYPDGIWCLIQYSNIRGYVQAKDMSGAGHTKPVAENTLLAIVGIVGVLILLIGDSNELFKKYK